MLQNVEQALEEVLLRLRGPIEVFQLGLEVVKVVPGQAVHVTVIEAERVDCKPHCKKKTAEGCDSDDDICAQWHTPADRVSMSCRTVYI